MKKHFLFAAATLATLVSSAAFATPETVIGDADGNLSENRSAAIVAQAMVPVMPFLGDSGLTVKTNVAIDRDAGVMTVSIKTDEPAADKSAKAHAREFKCDVFSVTTESSSLYVSKARLTAELQNGSRRDTVLRGECKDQLGVNASVVVSYDRDSYSVLIGEEAAKLVGRTANPRFDSIIGPLPKRKK